MKLKIKFHISTAGWIGVKYTIMLIVERRRQDETGS